MFSRSPTSVRSPVVHLEQFVARDLDVVAQCRELVGLRHQLVEHVRGDRHQVRVRDPGAVIAVLRLALLVGAHLREGGSRSCAGSPRFGICAAMPPMAKAPRRWQVLMSSSE